MACASSKFKISCKAQFAKLKATCTKLVEEECLRNCSATQAKACSTDAMCVMPVGGKDADFSCECKRGFTGDGFRCIVDPEFDESVEDAKAVEAAAAQAAAPTSKPKPDICFQKLGIKNGGCHGDASCGFHPQTFEMKCQCNEGYQGDGKSCTGTFTTHLWPVSPAFFGQLPPVSNAVRSRTLCCRLVCA